MLEASHSLNEDPMPYATQHDFRRIFEQDMNSLYCLSFLLTADREKAEQCFVSGLEDSVAGNRVFKDWATSWARRTIIQSAVRLFKPRPTGESGGAHLAAVNDKGKSRLPVRIEFRAVFTHGAFARFVFVMSVLERYSDQDCSALLGCSRRDVVVARTRALQQIADAFGSEAKQPTIGASEGPALLDPRTSVLRVPPIERLARST